MGIPCQKKIRFQLDPYFSHYICAVWLSLVEFGAFGDSYCVLLPKLM